MAELLPIPVPSIGWHVPGPISSNREIDRPPSPSISLKAVAFGPAISPYQILDSICQTLGCTCLKYGSAILLSEMHSRDCPGGTIISEHALLLDLLPDLILYGKSIRSWKCLIELHITLLDKMLDLSLRENLEIH